MAALNKLRMRHTLEDHRFSMFEHRRSLIALALGAGILLLVGCQSPQAEVVLDNPGEGATPADGDADSTQKTTTDSEGSEFTKQSGSVVDGSQDVVDRR